MQLCRLLPVSTYCPSQKRAPLGSEQWPLQPPSSWASQLASPRAWHAMLQVALALAVHEPLHEAWHFASHVAEGGVPSHFALHEPLQLAWHCVVQSALFADEEHWLVHDASHDVRQLALQSKLPGLELHEPVQSPVHEPVQLTSGFTVHWPVHVACSFAEHAALKCTGVHWAVQPPDVTSVQLALAFTSMSPQGERSAASAREG